MAKGAIKKGNKVNSKITRITKAPLNDGTDTPVPDRASINIPSESEAALFKQAKNPLGDPHKL